MEVPKHGKPIMENPIKLVISGYPYFRKPQYVASYDMVLAHGSLKPLHWQQNSTQSLLAKSLQCFGFLANPYLVQLGYGYKTHKY